MNIKPDNKPPAGVNYPKIEEEIAEFWKQEKIFERSVDERPESKSFVFYDGPPFATGLPHYGHLLQSAIKDAVPRYWTMKGHRVARRWGWDCHGLPIETLVEKELKLKSKRDIEKYGIENFNQACRKSVMKYEHDWDRYVQRLGRWVDFEHAYETMDANYIESVWWVFAELYKKSCIYKDLRVSLFCPRCSTPLSNFEIAMGDSYEDRTDPAITVKFKVKGQDNTYLLAWTTTPWTLLANTAIAVHPDLVYLKVKMEDTGEILILADARKTEVLSQHYPLAPDEAVRFEVVERLTGRELEGLEYEPLYIYAEPEKNKKAYRVVAMDYVSAEDGTGLVHTAPAFGEEDFTAAKKHNLAVLLTVDDEGRQKPEMGPFAGLPVKDSNAPVIEDLKQRGILYRQEEITHSIPICWRCQTELLHKAQPAWYVNVTNLKKKMLQTAKKINWHPEHFKEGRFGKGLETAPDWCISRTRYWGAPLPVWACDKCDKITVVGSVSELQELVNYDPQPVARNPKPKTQNPKLGFQSSDLGLQDLDLHRPGIDQVKLKCACGGEMARVPEVFDCWFESGSMPYASNHYPFENKAKFDANFPADFIGEAQDQTRGWFYSLHVLATALFGKPATKHIIVTGLIMAEDGKKMSKSLKNYPDPWELMTTLGADALRLYLLSSPVMRAEQLNFSFKDCQMMQRATLGLLWNVRNFYLTYAGAKKIKLVKPRSAHILDRWIFSRLAELKKSMTENLDAYDLAEATRALRPFIDDLSTWWLRRSRERIKGEDQYERVDALRTLREVLLELSRLMAPFAPFFAEKLFKDLGGDGVSVHLEKWPKYDERLLDQPLLQDMQWTREVVTQGLEARATAKIPVRQALACLTVLMRDAAAADRLRARTEFSALMAEELNVEQIKIQGGCTDLEETQLFRVELDTKITPELKRKGLIREMVRHFMDLRKNSSLSPQDIVSAQAVIHDAGLKEIFVGAGPDVAKEIKAAALEFAEELAERFGTGKKIQLDGQEVIIGLVKKP